MKKRINIILFVSLFFYGCANSIEHVNPSKLNDDDRKTIDSQYMDYKEENCEKIIDAKKNAEDIIYNITIKKSGGKSIELGNPFEDMQYPTSNDATGLIVPAATGFISLITRTKVKDANGINDNDRAVLRFYELKNIAIDKIIDEKKCIDK